MMSAACSKANAVSPAWRHCLPIFISFADAVSFLVIDMLYLTMLGDAVIMFWLMQAVPVCQPRGSALEPLVIRTILMQVMSCVLN